MSIPHGSGHSYSYYACRCDECREANRIQVKRHRDAKRLEPKAPDDPRHGTASFYRNHGCRCQPCTAANSLKCTAYQVSGKVSA